MANILHLDDNAVAGSALKGILLRSEHRCVTVTTPGEAWTKLHKLVRIDLVVVEPKLKSEDGLPFIQKLRNDPFLKEIPVLVYSGVSDHGTIQRSLGLKIQRYLVKPFDDAAVDQEVGKAAVYAWRDLHFEEARSFCAQMGLTPAALRELREELMVLTDPGLMDFAGLAQRKNRVEIEAVIGQLEEKALAAGVWAVANHLQELRTKVEASDWPALAGAGVGLDFARRLTYCHLNPEYLPDEFFSEEELSEKAEAADRGTWLAAAAENAPAMASAEATGLKLDQLKACPTIDTVVAAFQMTANGTVASMNSLMDLVSKDPGLSVQVLAAVNRLDREDRTPVEDPRAAVALLGELRLQALARTLPIIPGRRLNFPPFSWPQFSRFQRGVGQLAKFACDTMELTDIAGQAYVAGLLHDYGKLLLLRIHPFALETAIKASRIRHLPLAEAERQLVGMSTWEMAERFSAKIGLSPIYVNVMRWIDAPGEASEDAELVAVVSLARQLCIQHQVGCCGEHPAAGSLTIEATPAWQVLRSQVFPSFSPHKFESAVRTFCFGLKQESS